MATLSPTAPYIMDFRVRVSGPVEIAPGIFRRISKVTGELETHVTPEGLKYLRRKRGPYTHVLKTGDIPIVSLLRPLEEMQLQHDLEEATRDLAEMRFEASLGRPHFLRNYDRAEALAVLRARCAGHVRRQGRVRR